MSEELNKSISAKDENAIDTVEQEEEYIQSLKQQRMTKKEI